MTTNIPRRPFYFIRHGKTDANAQGLMCGGDWDIVLNHEGQSQARSRALLLPTLMPPIEKIFASPMIRAQQTAHLLNEAIGVPIQTVEDLREWRVGDWDRRPWGEVPNPFETKEDPPGGETRAYFETRVAGAVANSLIHFSGVPLFVSHGASAHALFTVLDVDKKLIENCAIYFVEPMTTGWHLREMT